MRIMTEFSPTTEITAPSTDNPLTMKRERKLVALTDEMPDRDRDRERR